MKRVCLLNLLFAVMVLSASPQWPESLYIDGGGTWRARLPIMLSNPTGHDMAGRPFPMEIKEGNPLVGKTPGQFRLVDEDGQQLKFSVQDKGGEIVDDSPLEPGFILHIPLTCAAGSKATYYLYYSNPRAWASPDKLKGLATPPANGNFENIVDGLPRGWKTMGTNNSHRISMSSDRPASGKYCVMMECDEGAPKDWFKILPNNIAVIPGTHCVITVKVRGENVKGIAGWFIHVGNSSNGQMINHVEPTAEGTFDWRELRIEFTVPENANTVLTGSVLCGNGKAWFDDFTFSTDAKIEGFASFGKPEYCTFSEEGRLSSQEWMKPARKWHTLWLSPKDPEYLYRVPIRVTNTSDEPLENVIASVDVSSAIRNKSSKNAILTFRGKQIKTCQLGDNLLFSVSCPPNTTNIYYIYTTDKTPGENMEEEPAKHELGSDIPSDMILVENQNKADLKQFNELMMSAANLVRNPSFEEVENGQPVAWAFSGEKATASGATAGIGTPGGFGANHATFTIPREAPQDWHGWRQKVAVVPGRQYIYGAWTSFVDMDSPISIHAHMVGKDGVTPKNGFLNAGPTKGAESSWVPLFSTATMVPGTEFLEIHLTMNGHGTLRHDGVFVVETLKGQAEPLEARPVPDNQLIAWQVNPVVKTFHEDLPPCISGNVSTLFGEVMLNLEDNEAKINSTFKVAMARNEEESFQLALRSAKDLGKMTVSIEGLEHTSITASIGRVGYVPIDHKSSYYGSQDEDWIQLFPRNNGNSDGWAGWWPDPIIPGDTFTIQANETQPLWINFRTTFSTRPGLYRLKVKIANENNYLIFPLHLTVWRFILPSETQFPAIYDFRWNPQWARPGMSSEQCRYECFKLYRNKKICPNQVGADPQFKRDPLTGEITADFKQFDQAAEIYFNELKFPVSYTPGFFYCFGWAYPPRALFGVQPFEGEYPWTNNEPRNVLVPEYKRIYQTCLKLFMDHCRKKGWDKKFVLYISDEPHFSIPYVVDQMKALCAMIKEVEPELLIYSSTWRHCKDWDGYISLWGAGHFGCFPENEIQERILAADKFWFTTDGQMCTDTPLCAIERLLPHYCFKYGVDAYEFWGATWLTFDPWKYGWHSYIKQSSAPHIKPSWTRYPAGDGYLIYPGIKETNYQPVSTIRLEAARDGVDDYEYLSSLKTRALTIKNTVQQGEAAKLLAKAAALIDMPSAGGRFSSKILQNPDRLYELRLEIGEMLAK